MPSNPFELYTTCLKENNMLSDCEGVTAEGYWWHYRRGFH